jgi:type IV secretion system protein VirB1
MLGLLFQLAPLVRACAPDIAPETMVAIVEVESGGDPLAISVVGAKLKAPPTNAVEAIEVAQQLEDLGKTFFVGIAQLPAKDLSKLGLTYEQAFDPCENLKAAAQKLTVCYQKAKKRSAFVEDQTALSDALSCFKFGNFKKGYQAPKNTLSYVDQVRAAVQPLPPYTVPSLLAPLPFLPPGPVSITAVVPGPVVSDTPSAPLAPVEEKPLLVPPSSCSHVVLGSSCAPTSAPSSERKEAPPNKTVL